MQTPRRLRGATAVILIAATVGCATIRDSRRQILLVNSSPPGATIYRDGREVGRTPAFVPVPRGGRTRLTLASERGPVPVPLTKKYRWGGSFWPNLIYIWGAPIAWVTDLATGTAYRYQPPATANVTLTASDRRRGSAPTYDAVIAPPRSDEPALTDVGGLALEQSLRGRAGPSLRPYRDSLPTFQDNGYDFDGAPAELDRGALYGKLDAGVIYESEIVRRDDRPVVLVKRHELFTNRVTKEVDVELDGASSFDRIFTVNRWWSRLLPNMIGLDLASSRIQLNHETRQFTLAPPRDGGWLARTLDALAAFKITSLPARRLERSLSWTLSLVPTVRGTRRTVVTPDLPPAAGRTVDQTYTRWLGGLGYGPELGLQYGRHYGYLSILPSLVYTRVETAGRAFEGTDVQTPAEVGYIYYLTKNWNLRLFTRSQSEDADVWRPALADRLGTTARTATITNLVSGISVGYRFEPAARARGR